MEKEIKQPTEKLRRHRKMLLVAPLVVVPMLLIGFYGLGGGSQAGKAEENKATAKGYNTHLPPAYFDKKDRAIDKLGFYQRADLDSERLHESLKKDPYSMAQTSRSSSPPLAQKTLTPLGGVGTEQQADQVLQRLEQLKKAINQPGLSAEASPTLLTPTTGMTASTPGKAPATMNADPEMDKISSVLDKILLIQHPDNTAKNGEPATGAKEQTLTLARPQKEAAVNILGSLPPDSGMDLRTGEDAGGFIDIGEQDRLIGIPDNTIAAVIEQDQTLISGSTIALRIAQEAEIGAVHIPADQLIWGKATLAGERLSIGISSIRIGNAIYPAALQVYDLDGLPGIRIPGAMTRDVSKESADGAMGSLGLGSLDPSLGAQAANAGVQAAKTLMSRKIREVRVTLKAGYRVLLKNTKDNNH